MNGGGGYTGYTDSLANNPPKRNTYEDSIQ